MVTAKQIKAARKAAEESQEAFARRLLVDQGTISRWETDGPPQTGPAAVLLQSIVAKLIPKQNPARA